MADDKIRWMTFPLNKRLIASVDPVLIDAFHFSEQVNMEPVYNGIRSIKGMTKLNSTALAGPKARSSIEFKRESPVETHIIVQGFNSDLTSSYLYDNTTAVPGTGNFTILANPSAPVITNGGSAGTTTYSYRVVARTSIGTTTAASDAGTTTTGNATLSGANYNIITWSAVTGAMGYDVYRTAGGATQGKINASIIGASTLTFNDTGLAGSGTAPVANTTDRLYNTDLGATVGMFTKTPNGAIVFANGDNTLVYGGDSYRLGCALIGTGDPYAVDSDDMYITYNVTERLNNSFTDAENVVDLTKLHSTSQKRFIHICSPIALCGFDIYISKPNTTSSRTMTVETWNGSALVSVTNMVDGTISGGTSMAGTGKCSVTFDTTSGTAVPRLYQEIQGYWYKISFNGNLSSGTSIYMITLKTVVQPMYEFWDGVFRKTGKMYYDYVDLTSQVYEQDALAEEDNYATQVKIEVPTTTKSYFTVFNERIVALSYKLTKKAAVTVASGMKVHYFGSSGFVEASGLVDNTKRPYSGWNATMAKTGIARWDDPLESNEFKTQPLSADSFGYAYKTNITASGSITFSIDQITAIPAPKRVRGHKIIATWQNRIVLCNESSKKPNSIKISGKNNEFDLSGADTYEGLIGDETDITAAGPITTKYGDQIDELLVVCQRNATHIVVGTNPGDYVIHTLSNTYGCVASNSFTVCDMGYEVTPGINKHIAIWAASGALVMFDGTSVVPIPDDVGMFDETSVNYHNPNAIDIGDGGYDEDKQQYHFLYASGTSTVIDTEVVYDVLHQKMFMVDRGTGKGLHHTIPVRDAKGKAYFYGFTDDGFMQRINYTTAGHHTFDGNTKTFSLRFADMPLYKEGELAFMTSIERIKILYKPKSAGTGDIVVTHYVDNETTGRTVATISQVLSGYRVAQAEIVKFPNNKGVFHSLEITVSDSISEIAFEPLVINIGYKVISEDKRGIVPQTSIAYP